MTEDIHPDLRYRARDDARPDGAGTLPLPVQDSSIERRLQALERALKKLEERQQGTERDFRCRLAVLEGRGASAVGMALKREFVAEPRRIARMAAVPSLPNPMAVPKRIIHAAVGLTGTLAVATWALGSVAGASVPPGGVSHAHAARTPLAKEIALADSGDARGEARLAFSYLRGSEEKAAGRWAMAAAEQGEPVAQNLIGVLDQAGEGTLADPQEARSWFEAAALGGNLKAMHNLAVAYAEGRGVAADPKRAAAWFARAAGQGYTDSQFDLAVLYERGQGVDQDRVSALKWYLIAAGSGDLEADRRAGELAKAMPTEDVAEAEMEAVRFVPEKADLAANSL